MFFMKDILARSAASRSRKTMTSSPVRNAVRRITGNAGSGKGIAILRRITARAGNGRAKRQRQSRIMRRSRQTPPDIRRKYARIAATTIRNLPSFVPAADMTFRPATGHKAIRHRPLRIIQRHRIIPADIPLTVCRLQEGGMVSIPPIMCR